ncbi:DMT family transporter [Levilactobacillus tangyuanensis]|uniref:DMT family transporter n=1 Tax=Levilactobacillus tangyuanensis TaxID=2486021 RepID=A0ABW1TM43_9LACO|nr:DMT family transporter [Levilactobacillus tangyuanensis]
MKRVAPFFVGLGAISYGVPATLFKIARGEGVVNGPLLFWSFLSSVVILALIQLFRGPRFSQQHTNWRQVLTVMAAGTATGFTNTFYITALRYVSVAVAAVMLMQAVWLSVLLAAIIHHQRPSRLQVLSIVLVLGGTVLAAGLLPIKGHISILGMTLSFLAAVAYAITIQVTASLGKNLAPLSKTMLMCTGAFIIVTLVWGPQIISVPITLATIKWGVIVSFFSMILPLLCYTVFMPLLALGVGPILSSLELPAAICVAFLILGERVSTLQILGVAIIIGSVLLTNLWHRDRL